MKKHWRKLKIIILILIIPFTLIFLLNLGIYFYPISPIKHSEEITIYDQNGKHAFSHHYYGFSQYVTLAEISPYMIKSIIASEDQRFYQHHGLDYIRIFASLINNAKNGEIVSGGSTITQQLARTLFLDTSKNLTRKIKEAAIAKKLEMLYSKEQILEMYLNSVYFGHNIYGIDEASHFFFNVDAKNLSLSQSALLTGIISAPSYYSPVVDEQTANQKKEQVLKIMFNHNAINYQEYQDALLEENKYYFHKKESEYSHLLYFYDALKQELLQIDEEYDTHKLIGYDIQTSLDVEISQKINSILRSFKISEEENQISIIVMKPNSGDILALVGGVDYQTSEFNRAISAYRQTGSTIKPLLYYLALQYGMNPTTSLISERTTFHLENVGEYSPSNASGNYANGPLTMVEALALSDNIYATKTLLLVGSDNLKNLLEKFKIENVLANPTIGLGTNAMTPLQLASIYNTFASEGKYYQPHIIREINLKDGLTIFKNKNQAEFSLNSELILTLNFMLRSPFDEALSSYTSPSLINYQTKNTFAAKTGSTECDSWVVGFNPDFTILTYVGRDDNQQLKNNHLAKQLFVSIANALTENKVDKFYLPTNNMKPFTIYNKNKKYTSFTYYSLH